MYNLYSCDSCNSIYQSNRRRWTTLVSYRKLRLNDKHYLMILNALEFQFRSQMGQWLYQANELAFEGFNYENHTDEDFSNRVEYRELLEQKFKEIERLKTTYVGYEKSQSSQDLIDLYMAMRYEFYKDDKTLDDYDTRHNRPLNPEEVKDIEVTEDII